MRENVKRATALPVTTAVKARPHEIGARMTWRSALRPLASLKLTVTLMAMAIFIVFVGTLAQYYKDMWEVVDDYFRSWIALIELRTFFPRSFFPTWPSYLPDLRASEMRFPFPGGALIGSAMALNLVAAHAIRFQVRARGGQWLAGLVVTTLGVLVTWLVIANGHSHEGLQGVPPVSFQTLWRLMQLGLAVTWIASVWGAVTKGHAVGWRGSEFGLLAALSVLLGAVCLGIGFAGNDSYLGDSGMRILWQLLQGFLAGLVLLCGCWFFFQRRAGVVLLHAGVGLMMFSQLYVSKYDVEEQITFGEGQTAYHAHDLRAVELAVIDRHDGTHADQDRVVVVPVLRNGKVTELASAPIEDAKLPFRMEIVQVHRNASLRPLPEGRTPVANRGRGRTLEVVAVSHGTGASGGNVDQAAVFVRCLHEKTGEDLGTYLLSQVVLEDMRGAMAFDTDSVEVDGRSYDLQLRFQRSYKPYSVKLLDVVKEDYPGTKTPRVYSSRFQMVDAPRQLDSTFEIAMNSPLRYAGSTFYQSSYDKDARGREYSTLSVVTNRGWMMPYVACMIIVTGMGAHFLITLTRFLRRQQTVADPAASDASSSTTPRGLSGLWFPAVVSLVALALVTRFSTQRAPVPGEPNLMAFGDLPVQDQGRIKPLDSLARNTLKVTSGRETFQAALDTEVIRQNWASIESDLKKEFPALNSEDLLALEGDAAKIVQRIQDKTGLDRMQVELKTDPLLMRNAPAIQFLLDLISGVDRARQHRVIRIDSQELLDKFGLPRRKKHGYAIGELIPGTTAPLDEEQIRTHWPSIQKDLQLAFPNLKAELLADFQGDVNALVDRVRAALPPEETAGVSEKIHKLVARFDREIEMALEVKQSRPDQLTFYQRKLLDLKSRLDALMKLHMAFRPPNLLPLPTEEEWKQNQDTARLKLQHFTADLMEQARQLEEREVPSMVPPTQADGKWQPYSTALARLYVERQIFGKQPAATTEALAEMLASYAQGDNSAFNQQLANYQKAVAESPAPELKAKANMLSRIVIGRFESFYQFERYFNGRAPFFWCSVLCVIVFALSALSWLGWSVPLQRAATWLMVITLTLHTIALIGRMVISGRPPVTNLYSSAIFIGWAIELLALLFERLFRNGMGTITAAACGFGSLVVAHYLGDGDTIAVMQAVLDTQFWLATHVVCIAFGYATTFLAGAFAIAYLLRRWLASNWDAAESKNLSRMIYGTICFAIFFSFFGTVLGGLWADDSWGRFWGWDPKENGALIILLWNALVLHARWDGMIRERGLAVLAIGGNIVTAWSWFGVNELGVGLHSYGFTEGVLHSLLLFVVSQLILMNLAWLRPWRGASIA